MKANEQFLGKDSTFWAYVKLISEQLGYSQRGQNGLRVYPIHDVINKLATLEINIEPNIIEEVVDYLNYRAMYLTNHVKDLFMNKDTAKEEFRRLALYHTDNDFTCSLPLNKQKHEKRDYAYFTGIVNIITEQTLRRHALANELTYGEHIVFDDDPRSLSYIFDEDNKLVGALSRRFDGAYPSTRNPLAIWEIKEYYYTTTFGSRIADGVYETQLDGFELNEISRETGRDVKHIYFIDDYNTWWTMGRSFLCRVFDMLHKGLVDEVICGREVLSRWQEVLEELLLEEVAQR
ncbi:DUF7687 domain-containing protein [Priestia megaterium]|uniref:DUF7687 domain-containing protein n=1 Tax=Priestia megaterium TaxID=1404 RepID=UPI001FB389E8|nr:hypothetical protein [Priestia megaterium]